MALSSELIDQLVKVTQNTEPRDKDNTAYGTVVIMGSKKYVKIDGSDLMTPVSSTVAVENGDRVIVTIKSHSATVTGNTSSPAASDKKVTELGTKISDFEIVIADKVSAKELDVQIGRIDDLTVDNATIKESLTANKAKIDDLTAKNAEITGTLEANKAKIDGLDAKKLDAEVADIKYASVDRLDATDANLRNLKSDYAQFEKTTTGELEATNAKIDGLDTKYANVDFSNIGKAAIERFYAASGIIKDLIVGDQTITGELVGITITGDLIKGNTIVADKLVIKGSDGLYYKLNTDGVTTEKEQTEYNSLNGQIIQAKSITATKIDVKDLVAFGATIGGFNIGQDSIFSGVKETVDNKSRGIYMDKNGQIAIGDVNNYIKYFKDTDGRYRLKISAASLEFNASGDSGEESKDLETVIKDINDKVDGIAKTNKGIGSITNYYLATSESSGVTTETVGWTTKIQNVSSSKKYLWNYEVTKYTDDTIANTTEPCIIGMYSAVGATGNGIQKITEYYALSALKDSVPTVWSENVPNLTATNKYLWNYEKILYTNGGTELTKKRIIGVYGDTGKDGAKGEDGYSPTATVSKNGDTTTITIVDKTGTHTQTVKDGMNGTPGKDGTNGKTTYFHVKYSNDGGKTFTSNSGETVGSYIGTCTNYTEADPATVGSYVWAKIKGEKGDTGAKGVGVSSVDVMYYKSTSATSLSGGSWVTTDPGWENGKYIWSKTVITYTDKTTDESTPVCITGAKGSTGGTGAKGETGAAGKGVTSIVEQYYQSTSATELSGGSWSDKYPGWVNGKYIWTRSVITYTDKTSTTTTAVCVTGAKGSTGNNGKSIGSVINYYLATSASSGVTTSTPGWTTTVQNVTLEKKYLWNYEVVKYSDGTVASTTSPCIIGTYGDTGKTGATGKNALQVLKQWNGTYTTIGQEVNCPTDRFNRIPVTGDMFTNVDASSNLGTWQITKVADGQAYFKMFSYVSAKGATGATGNGIKSIKEHYAVSTSNTVTPTSWLDDVPVTNSVNKYLWNYETITYTNGTSVDSKKRVIGVYGDTGKDGKDGAKGEKGDDFRWNLVKGTNVASTAGWSANGLAGSFDTLSKDERTYKFVASNGWHVARYVNLKEYVGQKVTISFYAKNVSAETTATESYRLFITNATGANPYVTGYLSNDNPVQDSWVYYSHTCKLNSDGQLGIGSYCSPENQSLKSTWLIKDLKIELGSPATAWSPHPDDLVGSDGKGIKSTAVTYQASTSGTVIPTGTWQTNIPTVSAGQYLWTRTVITYTDDSKSTSYSVGRMGTNGTNGANGSAGRGIKSTAITYQAGSSGTTAPTGTWQTTVPATSASSPYLWTRTIITYTDDTTSTSYAVGSTLEGVSVGGRNLARKTSNEYNNPPYTNFNGVDNNCLPLVNVYLKGLSVGDKVTVRLVYKYTNIVAVTGKTAAAWLQGNGNVTGWTSGTFLSSPCIVLSGSGEKVIKYSFAITSDMIKNQYWDISIRHDGVQSGSVQWKEFKVEKGNIATDWTPAPEDGIASVDVEYYLSNSATALSGGSWSTTAPTWVNGKYMWSRTVTTDGAGNKTYSPNQNGVCIAGAKGETGNKVVIAERDSVFNASSTDWWKAYCDKDHTDSWTTFKNVSDMNTGDLVYIKFHANDVNQDLIVGYKIISIVNNYVLGYYTGLISGINGATGATGVAGKGVSSIVEQYYKSTSATALSGGSWGTTYPGWESGKYIWTRSVITYTDKTTTTTTAVCVTGTKGSTGNDGKTSYVHMAYANITYVCEENNSFTLTSTTVCRYGKNDKWIYKTLEAGTYIGNTTLFGSDPANGVVKEVNKITGFSITDSSGRAYMGQYTNFEQAGSNDISKYVWTKVQGAKGETGNKGETGASGKNALQPKRNWSGTFTTIGATSIAATTDFNRTPVVGDVFINLDGSSNTGTWQVTALSGTSVTIKLLSYVNSKGAPGKDANQVVHSVAGNGNTNKYIEFATVKVIANYANYATTFKISGREYETTDVQFSFVSVDNTDPKLYFLRATGEFNVWMYKKTTSTWGLVTKLNEAWGRMRVYNFRPDNESISLTWTDTRHASLPSGCIAADQLQAAKTATNFMEFNSGTGLQIGDKTNGSWKGFRSRITSTAFEILNEAGAAVASYGRKLIQLGKDTTDAVIELCGGKGIIKYENVWLYGGEDDTLTISAENMAILADKNIVIRAKRVTADNIRITNQLFMSDTNIHLTMYEMNADLPDEADDCIAGIDIDKKYGINLETLGVTDRALTGVSINGRSLLNHIYPVGSIYMSTSATNPTNFFGGTWVAWGAGRVPVGFNGGDGNFNSSEKTGGSKTINIEHNHGLSNARAAVGRADSSLATMSYTSGGNPHNVYFDREFSYYGGISGGSKHATDTSLIYGNTNNGGSTAASVLQPYITCYMWKRTA
jgi:hypothetical protein